MRIACLLVGPVFAAGCGPAPYAQSPAEPEPREAEPAEAVYVIVEDLRAPEPPRPAPEPEDRWIPDAFPRSHPFVRMRTWVGDYDCAQGTTGLALRIIDVRGRAVRAIFNFHHVPSGAIGSYIVSGVYDEETRRVSFEPGPWITRPADYFPVGMAGAVSSDGTLFAGRMTSSGCGGFRLKPGL